MRELQRWWQSRQAEKGPKRVQKSFGKKCWRLIPGAHRLLCGETLLLHTGPLYQGYFDVVSALDFLYRLLGAIFMILYHLSLPEEQQKTNSQGLGTQLGAFSLFEGKKISTFMNMRFAFLTCSRAGGSLCMCIRVHEQVPSLQSTQLFCSL